MDQTDGVVDRTFRVALGAGVLALGILALAGIALRAESARHGGIWADDYLGATLIPLDFMESVAAGVYVSRTAGPSWTDRVAWATVGAIVAGASFALVATLGLEGGLAADYHWSVALPLWILAPGALTAVASALVFRPAA